VASSGTVFTSQALQDSTAPAVTSASLLTNLQDFGATGTTGLYNVGDVITLSPQQDGRNLPSQSYTVTATSSVQDLQTFFQNTLGIDPAATAGTPGSSIVAATGGGQQLVTTGNVGVENSLSISNNTGLLVNGSSASPITLTTTASTDTDLGSHTPITAYDSLGDPIELNVNTVLTSEGATGSTWQFTVTSPDNQVTTPDGQNPVLGTGTLQFNTSGQFVSATPSTFTINRSTSGAVANQPITLDFSKVQALAGASSSIVNSGQDGFPFGSFSSYSVGADGTITGTYSNGQTETVGQVVLATFQNPTGLVNQGSNNYTAGAASGPAVIATPNSTGTGSIQAATLEQSNVDLSQEFIDLIIASTGYSASSKVISTSDQLLNELLSTTQG
jgi:flagellar hook protein FlgE